MGKTGQVKKERAREYWEEGLDLKFLLLRLFGRLWAVVAAALAGGILCAGGYTLYRTLFPQAREYRAVTKFYIDFAEDSTGIGYGYYNDFTWNDLLKSDAILGYTMSLLPETVGQETVENAVKADIISDVRLLTITVTAGEERTAGLIMRAQEQSLEHFPEEIKEIDAIRVIRRFDTELTVFDDHTAAWAGTGAAAAAGASLFLFWILFVLDDSVYFPKDFERRYPYKVFGIVYKGEKSRSESARLLANFNRSCADREGLVLLSLRENTSVETAREILSLPGPLFLYEEILESADALEQAFDTMRASGGVLLCLSYGKKDGRETERMLSDLEQQGCRIAGAVLCGADYRMYRRYYLGGKKP